MLAENKKDSTRRKATHWGRFLNRLNILLVVVFLLFAMLILRLGYLQIVQGEAFVELVRSTETRVAEEGVPRGHIVDRNGVKLVDNEGLQAISYTRGPNISGEDMAQTAQKLAELITMDTKGVTERDRKDYWAATNMETLNDRLTDEEAQLSEGELYEAQLNKISDEDINYDDQELIAVAIYKKMNSAYALSTTFIKNEGVTDIEIARVSEHTDHLPGVHSTMDWRRTYPQKGLLRSILGDVTSEEEGLPADKADAYLAQGYARNDRVGSSYVEAQFEEVLRGSKTKYETELNANGEVIRSDMSYPGKMGDTVVLTVDTELQKALESIAVTYLESRTYKDNDRIYMVLTNPQNGEVLAMVGKIKTEEGEIIDDALGTINSAYAIGSTVKGATVGAGYHYDLLSVDEDNVITDEPLFFSGTPVKASWWYNPARPYEQVEMDDRLALARSSNVYMIKLAMMLGGVYDYYEGMTLENLSPDVYDKLRDFYAQFGLGVHTGIDLQNESTGLNGGVGEPGNALDLSFGQFDTYTTLQLNQYVATVANDGVRLAPHVFKEVRQSETAEAADQLVYGAQPVILNKVQLDQAEVEKIQEGFQAVVNDPAGLAYELYQGFPIESAGKTGTAEVDGNTLENSTWIGYAPYDDPEVAMSIVIPNIDTAVQKSSAQEISRSVLDTYFNLKND